MILIFLLCAFQYGEADESFCTLDFTPANWVPLCGSVLNSVSITPQDMGDTPNLACVKLYQGDVFNQLINVTHIRNFLIIDYPDPCIANLTFLQSVTKVGRVSITNTHFTTLENGLSSLLEVGGSPIDENDDCSLPNGMLRVSGNKNLINFSGLQTLTKVAGLLIESNDALRGLGGLNSLATIGEYGLRVISNPNFNSFRSNSISQILISHSLPLGRFSNKCRFSLLIKCQPGPLSTAVLHRRFCLKRLLASHRSVGQATTYPRTSDSRDESDSAWLRLALPRSTSGRQCCLLRPLPSHCSKVSFVWNGSKIFSVSIADSTA